MSGARCFDRVAIRADRVRRIDGSFAFLPHRFLRDGFWASLTRDELSLYVLLVLVADRQGMSFYYDDRLWGILRLMPENFVAARAGLVRKDLVAYDSTGPRYQVLSLPARPLTDPTHRARPTAEPRGQPPAPVRDLIRDFLTRMDQDPR